MSINLDFLNGLPQPDIIEPLDPAVILQARRDDLVQRMPELAPILDLESEPLRKSLQENSYRELILRARINEAFRQTLVVGATGAALDALAGFYDVARLEAEDDGRLRARLVLEIAARSPGGTAPRYRARALGSSLEVADAHVWVDAVSPVVNVAILSTSPDGTASPALLEQVRQALDAPDFRMVSDRFRVRSAVTIHQDIRADVWILPGASRDIFEGLEAGLRAAWKSEGGLGFDLTRAWITARLMVPGVQRVELAGPVADGLVVPHEALALGAISLTNRGVAQ